MMRQILLTPVSLKLPTSSSVVRCDWLFLNSSCLQVVHVMLEGLAMSD